MTEITKELLEKEMFAFLLKKLPEREALAAYYRGEQPVTKGRAVPGRPNNILRSNICRYITDVHTGYFMGVPMTFDFESGSMGEKAAPMLREVLEPMLFEAARDASIYGTAFAMVKAENGGIRTVRLDPEKTFAVEDEEGNQAAVVKFKGTKGRTLSGEIYTGEGVRAFEYRDRRIETSPLNRLPLGAIPIVEFKNNPDRTGDFQPVTSLMDAYNLLLSGAMDDMQSVATAFLALYGMQGTTKEDIDEANRSRVLSLSENGKAEFVVKNVNPAAIDSLKSTLMKDMLMVTKTPDLSDESFAGNVSGVAMEYKLWGIEQSRSQKQRCFAPAVRELARVLGLYWGYKDVTEGMKLNFYKNLPQDVEKICSNLSKVSDIVSRKTRLELLPFVKDVPEEMRRLEKEKQDETEQI